MNVHHHSELAIDVHHLTKVFDKRVAVDKVSLTVNRGAVFGFLGSNGSGKTTMIRMICGLLTPTSGRGFCLGYDILTQSDLIKQKIGYMPQKFSLYNGLTVYETLRFFADVYQIVSVKPAIDAIVADLNLEPYLSIKVGFLSGGWKQRLALGCCLLHKPALLFLDEPTAGVDPKARKDFWNYLHQIATRDQTTILVTTHYMDEAEKCTDLAYISLGKLFYSGTTKALIPTSGVKTYLIESVSDHMDATSQTLAKAYPNLLIAFINNEIRISSRNQAQLQRFIQAEESTYALKEVTPSFEEVFIGLMQ